MPSFTFCADKPRVTKELIVPRSQFAALLVPLRQITQLHLENRRLEAVQPRVPANLVVIVAAAHAVGAQHPRMVVDLGRSVVTSPASPIALRFFVG